MDGKSLAAGCVIGLEGILRPRTRLRPESAASVLVLEYLLPLGSCVHMTPLYEALKRGRPDLTITVATRALGLQVLRHSPFIDHLIETPDPLVALAAAARSLARQLNRRGLDPDACLTGAPDQRTRIALLGMLACSGWRGGFTVQPSLYQHPLVIDKARSQIANNLRLAELLGCPGEPLEPRVFYSAQDASTVQALVDPLRSEGRPVLSVVTQNSGGQRTGWHHERWAQVLSFVYQQLGFDILYLGTAGDASAIAALQAESGGFGHSLAGKTSIGELAAVLALSDLVISVDTGTMHVGRATGVPMVVLGPSWQKPVEWLPLGKPHVRILRGEDRVGVPDGYQLDEISAQAVKDAVAELAKAYPARDDTRMARLHCGISPIDLLVSRDER